MLWITYTYLSTFFFSSPNVHKGRWAPEEDEALTQAVKKYSNRSVLPWNRIAQNIPNRTGIQCQARWTEALDPTVRKGRWRKEEDEMLRQGVARFGCCWIRVSGMIYGRTQRQCRTRWNQIKSRKEKAMLKLAADTGVTATTTTTTTTIKLEDQQEYQETPTSPISLIGTDASSPFSLEEKPLLTPPLDQHLQLPQHYQQMQWMNLPHSINVAVNPCETDYFCLSPPSPSSSLDDMLTLPDDDDVDSVDHESATVEPPQQPSFFTPCEFFRFDPELPSSSLGLPESDYMLNDLLSHSFPLLL